MGFIRNAKSWQDSNCISKDHTANNSQFRRIQRGLFILTLLGLIGPALLTPGAKPIAASQSQSWPQDWLARAVNQVRSLAGSWGFTVNPAIVSGTISGTVFLDYNQNGAMDTSSTSPNYAVDTGVSGVVVTAYDASGISVGTATTNSSGTYSLSATGIGPYRLEFTSLPSGYYAGAAGTNNASTVRFVADGNSSGNDLGLSRPEDYSQNNPSLATNCYVYADQVTGTYNGFPALLSFPYESGSVYTSTTESDYDLPVTHSMMLVANQVGTTWGLSYARKTNRLYAAAFFKRHTGFGKGADGTINTSDDPGAIYVVNPSTNTVVNTFTVPNATTNAHDTSAYLTDNGNTGWDAVGKTSLGGIDLSDDETSLYVMNLENRTLYRLNATTGAVLASQQVPLAPPGSPTGDSPDVDIRPFAVEYYHGQLYIGMTSTAQSTSNLSDLYAYVYTANPTTLAFSASPVFQTALNYPRGAANDGIGNEADWEAWRTTFGGNIHGTTIIVHPQPWLTSLAFESDNLVLGFRDRIGDQVGNGTQSNPSNSTLYTPRLAGDTLRACGNPTDGWTLESNGRCGGSGNAPQNTGQGPGNGEFYYQDDFSDPANSGNYHDEVALGGVASVPGFKQTLSIFFDPIPAFNLDIVFDNGVRWLNGNTGGTDRAYRVFNGDNGDLSTLGKASGLGDLALMSDPAPLQIGNLVWTDTNANGIQDPGENGIQNVSVQLWGDTDSNGSIDTQIGAATTSSSGNYYFGGPSSTNMLTYSCSSTVTVAINTGSDDAEQNLSTNAVNPTGSDLELLYDSTFAQQVGLRFNNLAIPNGATITGAYIQFTARDSSQTVSSGNPTITIRAQAADNPTTFVVSNNDISGRATTTASASWSPATWSASTAYQTSSITSVVQEVVNRAGWASGNSMVFIFSGDLDNEVRRAWTFEHGASSAARVVITYTASNCYYPINPTTNYEVRIPNASGGSKQAALGSNNLVTANTDASMNGDVRDSDATMSSTTAVIALTTSDYGVNNHTYDFGFSAATTSYSVGNRVWFDTDNDRELDGTESGVNNVTVELVDIFGASLSPQRLTTTNSSGYYRFDNVDAGVYKVRINAVNFNSGGALLGYYSSTGATSGTDQRDNGVDPTTSAEYTSTGVLSVAFTLGASSQPIAEPDFTSSGNGAHGTNGDVSDNLQMDFGFQNSSPLAVRLTGFTASAQAGANPARVATGQAAGGVTLQWGTGFEVGHLGFNLYREENGQRVQVNTSLIAGSALLAGARTLLTAGNTYVWTDPKGTVGVPYWLEAVDVDNSRIWYGPVYANGNGSSAETSTTSLAQRTPTLEELNAGVNRPTQIEYATLTTGNANLLNGSQAVRTEALANTALNARTTAAPSAAWTLPNQNAAKLFVRKNGWYRVTAAELQAAGFSPVVSPNALQLFAEGTEVPISVKGQGNSVESVEFYGQGLDTAASDTRVYWLTVGQQNGRRMNVQVAQAAGSASSTSFVSTVERQDKLIYFSGLLNGEAENWFGPVVNASGVTQQLTTHFVQRQNAPAATLEVALQGVTEQAHIVNIEFNGRLIGTANFYGKQRQVATYPVALDVLRDGVNDVRLVAASSPSDVILSASLRLSYPRRFVADGNVLRFGLAGGQSAFISGFSTPSIRLFELGASGDMRELTVALQGAGGNYGFALQSATSATYLALAQTQVERVAAVKLNQPSNWRATTHAADLVIITHRDFMAAANRLMARRATEMRVALVDVEDAYDEFAYGQHSPQAVKDLLAYARTQWTRKPSFALLIGDATNDPRNYLNSSPLVTETDFVPTKLGTTRYFETAHDGWLADANNDGVPDLALGRLPVRTAAQADAVINKILAFKMPTATTPRNALFISDRTTEGVNFKKLSERLADALPALMLKQFINRADGSPEQVRGQIVNSINLAKPLVVNWLGHGSTQVWTGDGLLRAQDAAVLNNVTAGLFVMTTCLNGYFTDPQQQSLGEAVLLNPLGGAFGVIASSGLSQPAPQHAFNLALYQNLFGKGMTLGEAMLMARAVAQDQDVRNTYLLFGDPTMCIYPRR
jgi:hypothetical protein